ncbi:SMP-30/gluconolactonase/LRE family protein [Nocardioides sp. AN3]
MDTYKAVPLLGTAEVATQRPHYLAEGPIWDPIRSVVLWVDIMDGAVYTGRLTDQGRIDAQDRIEFPDTAGAVAIAATGDLLVAGTHRLYYRSPGGDIEAGRQLIDGHLRRFNDGKPDPSGRMVLGTKGPTSSERLFRIDAGETATVLDEDLTLANGLAWSSSGRRLYTIDTLTNRIFVRDYDPETGSAGTRTLLTVLNEGHPDGMTTDAQDHLWVAVWGAGCVLRLSPEGEIIGRVDVPAPHTSCPVFAGPDLDTLVITTATEDLDTSQQQRFPLSGRLFTFKPGVTGNPPHLWSGTR